MRGTDTVGKDLNPILSRRTCAKRPFDIHDRCIASRSDCDDREIGLLIRSGVAVIGIIQSNAVAAQINAESSVGTNHIAQDRVTGCRGRDLNSRATVECDEITGSGRCSADDIAG